MKLLYVINSSSFFCSHFCHVAEYAFNHGLEVVVACGDDTRKEYLESLGFKFLLIPMSRNGFSIAQNIKCVFYIYKIIKESRADKVHFLTIKPVLFGGLVSRFLFSGKLKRTIFSITGLGSLYLDKSIKSKLVWFFIEKLYRFSLGNKESTVIFENDDDLSFFIDKKIISKGKSIIINGAGVNTDEFLPSGEKKEPYLITTVCRIIKDKGVLEYIEAGRILRERNVNVILQLVGPFDGENISSINDQFVLDADKRNFIKYLGERSDIKDIYRNSYAACLPSYREGLSKSLIEAVSCGLPLITTNVPGCRQLTRFDNGVTIEPRDALALADAIEDLVKDPEKAKVMGDNSRKAALEWFDSKIIANNFYEIYISE